MQKLESDHLQAISKIQKKTDQETINHNLVMEEIEKQQKQLTESGNIDFNQLAGN